MRGGSSHPSISTVWSILVVTNNLLLLSTIAIGWWISDSVAYNMRSHAPQGVGGYVLELNV